MAWVSRRKRGYVARNEDDDHREERDEENFAGWRAGIDIAVPDAQSGSNHKKARKLGEKEAWTSW